MIALLMLAAIVGGAAAALGAGAAEGALRLWRRPARGAWVAALAVTALLPLAAVLVAPRAAMLARALVAAAPTAQGRSGPIPVHELPAVVVLATGAAGVDLLTVAREALTALERPLTLLWLATSALALLVLWRGVRALQRAARAWTPEVVDGVAVAVAPDLGPAVLGVRRPRIVLPAWALALERPLRALVLRHEQEHARAGDPALLMAGALLVAAMPWNPAAWWIARRLRAAIEIDCDARVLRAHPDVTRYGLLLLAVAQRRDRARAAVPALAALSALAPSPTDLERRIATMRARPLRPRVRLARTLGLGAAAGASTVVALLACAAPDMVASRPRDDTTDLAAARTLEDSVAVALRGADSGVDSLMIGLAPMLRKLGTPDTTLLPRKVTGPGSADAPRMASGELMPKSADPDLARLQIVTPDADSTGEVYFEFQVEQPVRPVGTARGPRYPAEARRLGLEGEVLAQFVVDTTGRVVGPLRILKATGSHLFADAVIDAVTELRFEPARVGGKAVKQLVQQPFQFALNKRQL